MGGYILGDYLGSNKGKTAMKFFSQILSSMGDNAIFWFT